MSGFDHPHIVRLLDGPHEHQGRIFAALELMECDLAQALDRGAIAPVQVPTLIRSIAAGLEHAHQQGVIHRDIKPANILLTRGHPKLTDFDLVHVEDTGRKTRTRALGTLAYVAPELVRAGAKVTPAADQFGLAMTAACMYRGQCLEHDPDFDVFEREAWLEELAVPDGVRAVLRRGIARKPEQRWPGVMAFAEALAGERRGYVPGPRPSWPLFGSDSAMQPKSALGAVEMPQADKMSAVPGNSSTLPGLVMVPIPGGTFMMGSPAGVGSADERPQRHVALSPFLMSATTVTQAQYRAVTGTNPSYFQGDDHPVERVSWEDAARFCNALSRREGLRPAYDARHVLVPDNNGYRLPTEAQWEYACRAGNPGLWCFGDDEQELSAYAWFGEGSFGEPHRVALKKPNAWGLYDMHGNVWEWCWDSKGVYPSVPQAQPLGTASGGRRVFRGGSCSSGPARCRSACRDGGQPSSRNGNLGFRVVRPLGAEGKAPPEPLAVSPSQGPLVPHHRHAEGLPPSPPTSSSLIAVTASPVVEVQPGDVVAPATDFRPTLLYAPPGTFVMGSPLDEPGRHDNEVQHLVTLTRPLWVMETPVTRAQWTALLGSDPSYFKRDPNLPVERINWFEAVAFANALSENEGLPPAYEVAGPTGTLGGGLKAGEGWGEGEFRFAQVKLRPHSTSYRLPTEAEWEYLARAGTTTATYADDVKAIAWLRENPGETQPVGQKAANPWGLRDMLGNVWEWCEDWYGPYPQKSIPDPAGSPTGDHRVVRGGSWFTDARRVRTAVRGVDGPVWRILWNGFRLVRTP
jgi:formylglycine-generating enzyme required for sulfatase activity